MKKTVDMYYEEEWDTLVLTEEDTEVDSEDGKWAVLTVYEDSEPMRFTLLSKALEEIVKLSGQELQICLNELQIFGEAEAAKWDKPKLNLMKDALNWRWIRARVKDEE